MHRCSGHSQGLYIWCTPVHAKNWLDMGAQLLAVIGHTVPYQDCTRANQGEYIWPHLGTPTKSAYMHADTSTPAESKGTRRQKRTKAFFGQLFWPGFWLKLG